MEIEIMFGKCRLMTLIVLFQMMSAEPTLDSYLCPPPFPDMEAFFALSLEANFAGLEDIHNMMKLERSQPDNCDGPFNMAGFDSVTDFNQNRCNGSVFVDEYCPTTTVSTTTTTPTEISSTGASTTKSFTHIVRPSATVGPRENATTVWPGPGFGSSPSLSSVGTTQVTPNVPQQATQPDDNVIIYICVAAGAILVVSLIAVILVCRSRFYASRRSLNVPRRIGKLQRQRSDCQPIASDSQSDTYNTVSRGPSICTVSGNTEYYSNGLSSRDSINGDIHFTLVRENGGNNGSINMHYDTLNALEHPHALHMGGFGESSTDYTLPRYKKNRETSMSKDPNGDSLGRTRTKANGKASGGCDQDSGVEVSPTLAAKPTYISYHIERADTSPKSCSSSLAPSTSPSSKSASPTHSPKPSLVSQSTNTEISTIRRSKNGENAPSFAYDNEGFNVGLGDGESGRSRTVIDPPPGFRDPDAIVPAVAIVLPSVPVHTLREQFEDPKRASVYSNPDISSENGQTLPKRPAIRNASVKKSRGDDNSSDSRVSVNSVQDSNKAKAKPKIGNFWSKTKKPAAEVQPRRKKEVVEDIRL